MRRYFFNQQRSSEVKAFSYFDCAASTPVDDKVFRAMKPYFVDKFGNPASLHLWGQQALAAVDSARKFLADYFGVDFTGVIFTASATEANNLVIQGVINKLLNSRNKERGFQPHLIVSKIEHASILEPCRLLAESGKAEITYLDVDSEGFVKLSQLKKALKKETVLVSVMQVNNETGAIQPVQEISRIVKEFRQERFNPKAQGRYRLGELWYPLFHSDAAQGLGHLPEMKVGELGAELISVSGHKIYGPKGVGALISNLSAPLSGVIEPLIVGGGQEFGFRSGTEAVPVVVGFAKAVELAVSSFSQNHHRLAEIKRILVKDIKKVYPRAVINSPENSVAEILNVSFPGFKREELIYRFDQLGVAVSGGAACDIKALKPSHVLRAMGLPELLIGSAIRFSFGRKTTPEEVKYLLSCLGEIFSRENK